MKEEKPGKHSQKTDSVRGSGPGKSVRKQAPGSAPAGRKQSAANKTTGKKQAPASSSTQRKPTTETSAPGKKRAPSRGSAEKKHSRSYSTTEKDQYQSRNTTGKKESPARKTHGKKGAEGRPRPKRSEEEGIRLNKYIASAGICSRREADELIRAGLVSVNGKVVSEMGVKVKRGDDVRYNGERLQDEKKVYLLLNKPKDFITTVDDPHASKTVMQLVARACRERIYPVGRLDRSTTGVLLFTNDGDLAKRLTHPSYNKKKIYHVHLDKPLRHADLKQIAEGIELEDGFIKADAIAYPDPSSKREVGIEIHSGRNRIIRRIFEKLEYRVVKLDRVYFAGLTKKNLPRGRWRFLTNQEIKMLKTDAFE